MTSQDIIEKLKQESSEKYKANVIKMGVPEENSIGVPTSQLRTIAKEIGKSNEIAYELWNSGYHDAKLLAVLVFEVKKLSFQDIDQLMNDVISWDLCNFICKQMIMKRKDYDDFIEQWIDLNHVYKKRAAFVLIEMCIRDRRKRFLIALALMMHKDILLLDEPTSSLDNDNKKILIDLLKKLSQKILVVCTSHDDYLISQADQIYTIRDYQIIKEKETVVKESLLEEQNHKPCLLYTSRCV